MSMDTRNEKQSENKVSPQASSGTVPVAGQNLPIGPSSVGITNQGANNDELIKGLKEAVATGMFPQPQNEDESTTSKQ